MYKIIVVVTSIGLVSGADVSTGTYGSTIDGHGISLQVASSGNSFAVSSGSTNNLGMHTISSGGGIINSLSGGGVNSISAGEIHSVNTGSFQGSISNIPYPVPSTPPLNNQPTEQATFNNYYISQKGSQAALQEKQLTLQNLQNEIFAVQQLVQEQLSKYYQMQQAANNAQTVAIQAKSQVETLNAALVNAQANAKQAAEVAINAQAATSAQQGMIEQAQKRLEITVQKLKQAFLELQSAESSASKATSAARSVQDHALVAGKEVSARKSMEEMEKGVQ